MNWNVIESAQIEKVEDKVAANSETKTIKETNGIAKEGDDFIGNHRIRIIMLGCVTSPLRGQLGEPEGGIRAT